MDPRVCEISKRLSLASRCLETQKQGDRARAPLIFTFHKDASGDPKKDSWDAKLAILFSFYKIYIPFKETEKGFIITSLNYKKRERENVLFHIWYWRKFKFFEDSLLLLTLVTVCNISLIFWQFLKPPWSALCLYYAPPNLDISMTFFFFF